MSKDRDPTNLNEYRAVSDIFKAFHTLATEKRDAAKKRLGVIPVLLATGLLAVSAGSSKDIAPEVAGGAIEITSAVLLYGTRRQILQNRYNAVTYAVAQRVMSEGIDLPTPNWATDEVLNAPISMVRKANDALVREAALIDQATLGQASQGSS